MVKVESAKQFLVKGSQSEYRFPFKLMHPNYGRIEWCVELFFKKRGKYSVMEKMHVWAKQTDDPRYTGKVFELPAFAEMLHGHSLPNESGNFLNRVWRVHYCPEHKTQVMDAYPPDGTSVFIVDIGSSISVRARFE